MSRVTIRNIDPAVKERLRVRAAHNGRSMEAELRAIVSEAVEAPSHPSELNLYDRIRARFEPLGGVDDPFRSIYVSKKQKSYYNKRCERLAWSPPTVGTSHENTKRSNFKRRLRSRRRRETQGGPALFHAFVSLMTARIQIFPALNH